jgi:hypothetical protein
MLQRKCLHQPPMGSLLFDPASSSIPWISSIFTQELRRVTAAIPTFPPGFGAQLYRQICTAIATKHVHAVAENFNRHDDSTARAGQDVVFAWQSGHRPLQQSTTYGLDGAYPAHLQPTLLAFGRYELLVSTSSCMICVQSLRLQGEPNRRPHRL